MAFAINWLRFRCQMTGFRWQFYSYCHLPSAVCHLTSAKSLNDWKSLSDGAPTACTYTVSGSISLPSLGFFSPFLHSTGSLSVNQEYLALEDGPPIFRQNFSCSALLLVSLVPPVNFWIRGYHPVSLDFPVYSSNSLTITNGSSAFARRYSQNLGWFLFLGVLRCFSSPGLPRYSMYSNNDSRFFIYWVSPFGYLGLNASYRLIQAFRRLARPSSPLIAKASTVYA